MAQYPDTHGAVRVIDRDPPRRPEEPHRGQPFIRGLGRRSRGVLLRLHDGGPQAAVGAAARERDFNRRRAGAAGGQRALDTLPQ